MICKTAYASLTLLSTLILAITGCNGNGNTSTIPAPQVPLPASSPLAAPDGGPVWEAVTYLVSFCDYPTCHGAQGFTVYSDGTFSIVQATPPDGSLTAAEFATFSGVAAQVVAEAPIPAESCTNKGHLVGASSFQVSMTFNDGSLSLISSQSTETDGVHACVAGDPPVANSLQANISLLALKYDPGSMPAH